MIFFFGGEYNKALPVYEKFFKDFIYFGGKEGLKESEAMVPKTNQILVFSNGGLHSKKNPKILCFDVTNSSFRIFDLDIQSFYTNILIKLCDDPKFNGALNPLKELLIKMNSERVILKKKNPVMSSIFKIIILSITGNLN